MKISMGEVNIYYDNEYNIGKFTIMKDGHEVYLEKKNGLTEKVKPFFYFTILEPILSPN